MVKVTFYEDSRHRLSSFVGTGHAQIAETSLDEYSMVCAAVSAVLQAAAGGLEEHAGIKTERAMAKGKMRVAWPAATRNDPAVRAIAETAYLALRQIAKQYPKYVRVTRAAQTG
jgi:uncharacterized protein YsxB (DUF464 family)